MYKPKPFHDASPGIHEPLCGWQFVYQHKDDVIPHEIAIKTPTATYSLKGAPNAVSKATKLATK